MLPISFCERMKSALGEEYEAFIRSLDESDAVKGIRVNGIKADVDTFLKVSDLAGERIPYTEDGFYPTRDEGLGNTPEHHSGMIYVQDPGAMAPLWAVDIKEGYKVADLCSAPGGKSAQAAARIGDSGFLLSNEYVPKRAKLTVSNFERLGIKNAIVTSMDTAELTQLFSEEFDLVICDVPCSGEGMFRKNDLARAEWSPENVTLCAKRQRDIIRNAARLVKPGGTLLYSTCTWSYEENEEIIRDFIKDNVEFRIEKACNSVIEYTKDGSVSYGEDMKHTRRFYPHVAAGEGQFFAVLKKEEKSSNKQTILYKDGTKPLSKLESAIVDKFLKDNFTDIPKGRIVKCGESVTLISHSCPIPPRSVFMSGVLLGEIKGNMLFPSHQLFSAYGNSFKNKIDLSRDDERLKKYLRGEEISADPDTKGGFCAVLFEGVSLGGGKSSGGVIKNHYPKGLRIKG